MTTAERNASRIATLEPIIRPLAEELIAKAAAVSITLLVTSARRTLAEQQALYDQGRAKPGQIVTKAQPGQSAHNFGLAFDVVPVVDGQPLWNAPDMIWRQVGEIGVALGLTWGGNFKSIVDKPHFEHPIWREAQYQWQIGNLEVA